MQSYYEKYLKYKAKYLNLSKLVSQKGQGGSEVDKYEGKNFSWFEDKDNRSVRNTLISELERKLKEREQITPKQVSTYLQAIDAKFWRNRVCESNVHSCPNEAASALVIAERLKQALNLDENTFKKYATNIAGVLEDRRKRTQIGGAEKAQVYLFKAEWCGHCKGFKSTWEKIQKDLKGKYEFITFDSDNDKKEISQWGIKGFPTIIKKVNNNAEEYLGPRDEISVKEFIEKI